MQVAVLGTAAKQTLTIGELAAKEQVRPPTITVVVDRLQEHGLVRRRVDDDDRRVVRVEITNAGRRYLARRHAGESRYLLGLLESMTEEERVIVARCIDILDRVFEVDSQAPTLGGIAAPLHQ